jgi:quercetin dioxygenase-like cupin family protein
MISQIERGRSSPSLRSLRLLAEALEVPISQFFESHQTPLEPLSPYVLMREHRRLLNLNGTGVRKAYLLPHPPELMEIWEFRIAPGGSSGGDLRTYEGEKAGLVLAGRVRLSIDGELFELREGDSFGFSSSVPHQIENPYAVEAVLMWVIVTPNDHGPRRKL